MADEQQPISEPAPAVAPPAPAAPAYLTFEDILNLTAITEQDLVIAGWGDKPLRMRPLSIMEVQEISKDSGGDDTRAAQLLVARCLINPTFTEAQAALLWTRAAGPVKALMDVVKRLNGLGGEAAQQAQADATEHAFRA